MFVKFFGFLFKFLKQIAVFATSFIEFPIDFNEIFSEIHRTFQKMMSNP
jgi:hypothetical protein